jgi:hypothetical protein
MVKAFAASAFAFAVLFGGGLAAVACDSSPESTFDPEPPKPDVEDGPISSLIPDGGGPGDGSPEAGPASCPPAIPAAFAPTWTAPTKTAACTAPQLKGYYDACLADPAKTEADGTCSKFKAAADTAACGACAEPDNKTGPVQWQLNRKFYTINVAGCIAITQNAPEVGKCGEAYNAAVQCTRQSCESCFDIGGTFDQFRDCQKSVQGTGICKSYETAQGTACTGYKDTGSPALACFNSGTELQEAHFTRVVATICGP